MRRRAAAVIAWALVLCGCGVTAQAHPERLTISSTPSASQATEADSGSVVARVYFVRASRLEGATRSVSADDAQTVLGALVTGPERSEVLAGLRTAIAPQSHVTITTVSDGTVRVDLPRDLTGLTGENQLLAFAQLVWTLTEVPDVRSVEFLSAETPVEVPTDTGLASGAVGRGDYASVSPLLPTPPSGTD